MRHERIASALPMLRRFARAATGSQTSGDAYVASTLEAVIAEPSLVSDGPGAKIDLYRTLLRLVNSIPINREDDIDATNAGEERILQLPSLARQAFLLNAVEDLDSHQIADVLELSEPEVISLLDEAGQEIASQLATDVLIIEDEPLIALDLKQLVTDLGHRVMAVARTEAQALAAIADHRPGLVLADIQLADGSSGLSAVKTMLQDGRLPVVFITAFPERLLTGDRPEPTFLLTKPFRPAAVKAIISQVLFFEWDAGNRATLEPHRKGGERVAAGARG